jgi:hypothetical protein
MHVKIYQPSKTAMQAGHGNTRRWVLEFVPGPRRPEPLMGWTSSADTRAQVRLWFDTTEDAIAHARKNGWMFTVHEPHRRAIRPKAYADNFAYTRQRPWTH